MNNKMKDGNKNRPLTNNMITVMQRFNG